MDKVLHHPSLNCEPAVNYSQFLQNFSKIYNFLNFSQTLLKCFYSFKNIPPKILISLIFLKHFLNFHKHSFYLVKIFYCLHVFLHFLNILPKICENSPTIWRQFFQIFPKAVSVFSRFPPKTFTFLIWWKSLLKETVRIFFYVSSTTPPEFSQNLFYKFLQHFLKICTNFLKFVRNYCITFPNLF